MIHFPPLDAYAVAAAVLSLLFVGFVIYRLENERWQKSRVPRIGHFIGTINPRRSPGAFRQAIRPRWRPSTTSRGPTPFASTAVRTTRRRPVRPVAVPAAAEPAAAAAVEPAAAAAEPAAEEPVVATTGLVCPSSAFRRPAAAAAVRTFFPAGGCVPLSRTVGGRRMRRRAVENKRRRRRPLAPRG